MRLNNVRGICVYLPIQYLYKESFWSNEAIQWRRLLISILILNLTFRVDDETQIVTDFSNPTGTVGLGKNFVWNKILFFLFFPFFRIGSSRRFVVSGKVKNFKKVLVQGGKVQNHELAQNGHLVSFWHLPYSVVRGCPVEFQGGERGIEFCKSRKIISVSVGCLRRDWPLVGS